MKWNIILFVILFLAVLGTTILLLIGIDSRLILMVRISGTLYIIISLIYFKAIIDCSRKKLSEQ